MILTFYIDVPNNISVRRVVGKVGKAEFLNSLRVIWQHPDYDINQNHLLDLRRCKITMSTAELDEVSKGMTTNDNVQDRKVAILVEGSNPAGHSAMYSEKTKHKHLSEVFASVNDAMAYTNAPADIFDKLNSELATVIEL